MKDIIWLQVQDFRIYSQEVVEFGEKVSFLLLLPPSDEVCTAPGQNNPYSPRSGFLTLPLQIFELGESTQSLCAFGPLTQLPFPYLCLLCYLSLCIRLDI